VRFYHGHHEEFKDFLSQEDDVMFCNDAYSIMEVFGKGKAIPSQALTGPEGSRRLRLPYFKIIST
jgi:hypothetical protein